MGVAASEIYRVPRRIEFVNQSVSIIIPCYNKRAYVAATIESALAQTHPCEVIIVDDGSTDGSLDEIKQYDGQVRWITGPNRGGCAARNTGIEMATGDYLQFLDADDILPPEKVATQLARLKEAPDDAIAVSGWSYLQDDGTIAPPDHRCFWKDYPNGIDLLLDMWLDGGFFSPHPWLVPRALALKTGPWNIELAADQDGEYFGRLLLHAGPVLFCDGASVLYRHPPEGAVSRDKSRRAAESRMRALDILADQILSRRNDHAALIACFSRVCKVAYALRDEPGVMDWATTWERRLGVRAVSPSLPPLTRWLVSLLGVKSGLQVRFWLKS